MKYAKATGLHTWWWHDGKCSHQNQFISYKYELTAFDLEIFYSYFLLIRDQNLSKFDASFYKIVMIFFYM